MQYLYFGADTGKITSDYHLIPTPILFSWSLCKLNIFNFHVCFNKNMFACRNDIHVPHKLMYMCIMYFRIRVLRKIKFSCINKKGLYKYAPRVSKATQPPCKNKHPTQ